MTDSNIILLTKSNNNNKPITNSLTTQYPKHYKNSEAYTRELDAELAGNTFETLNEARQAVESLGFISYDDNRRCFKRAVDGSKAFIYRVLKNSSNRRLKNPKVKIEGFFFSVESGKRLEEEKGYGNRRRRRKDTIAIGQYL